MNTLFARLAVAAAVLVSGLLGGCATVAPDAKPVADMAAAQPVAQTDYLIGPGDSLNIVVWRNPEVSGGATVRPDGKVTTPLVEDLQASGKTATELARDIEKALSRYLQQPVVTVVVTGFVGNYNEQVRVIGQAAKPQALPYRKDMSLLDVLIAVGGTTEFAAGNRAVLVRRGQKIPVRLDDLVKRGDISANAPVLPGDVLVIPESFF